MVTYDQQALGLCFEQNILETFLSQAKCLSKYGSKDQARFQVLPLKYKILILIKWIISLAINFRYNKHYRLSSYLYFS